MYIFIVRERQQKELRGGGGGRETGKYRCTRREGIEKIDRWREREKHTDTKREEVETERIY